LSEASKNTKQILRAILDKHTPPSYITRILEEGYAFHFLIRNSLLRAEGIAQ
jgi:hypothetical protein